MLAAPTYAPAQCCTANQPSATAITVQDEIWLSEWLPFLFAGKHNVALLGVHSACTSRDWYFSRLAYNVALAHLVFVTTRDITPYESTAMRRVLTDYVAATAQ